ncbi:hypothetical protein SDC9_131759 [bioreactor metagenome]|uniref:Uncharacterized protein n=1 Tax=bioreactor metagenome TaxID=1076179 RepID=A0A645D5Q3_9ZZZZ
MVARLTGGQHQQMAAGRVGSAGLRGGQVQRQLGTEDGPHPGGFSGLGEPGDPVEPVVVGERQRGQSEPLGLDDQVGRCGGPVEEGERRMGVQFGVRDGIRGSDDRGRAVAAALVGDRGVHPGRRGRAGVAQRPFEVGPGHRRVVEAHQSCLPISRTSPRPTTGRRRRTAAARRSGCRRPSGTGGPGAGGRDPRGVRPAATGRPRR